MVVVAKSGKVSMPFKLWAITASTNARRGGGTPRLTSNSIKLKSFRPRGDSFRHYVWCYCEAGGPVMVPCRSLGPDRRCLEAGLRANHRQEV